MAQISPIKSTVLATSETICLKIHPLMPEVSTSTSNDLCGRTPFTKVIPLLNIKTIKSNIAEVLYTSKKAITYPSATSIHN